MRFLHKTMTKSRVLGFAPRVFNGLPALVFELRSSVPGVARYSVHCFQLDQNGRIARIYSVLATRKLMHLELWQQLAARYTDLA